MSGKNAHAQDSSVLERRLRPIYDWLDAYNYKKAIQECDKVLKKSPNLDRARALKALSLLRMGKEAECTAILDALVTLKPSDDSILQAMTLCYRELQQLDRICKLYEAAVKVEPTNEELHTHLFMSYVCVNEFKQQQQSAMALYKLMPKNPYYCWAVMSIILQATRGDGIHDTKKRTLLLSLAERMIDKFIQDNKLEAEQEVQLYVMILEEQGKYQEVLNVLDGPLGNKLSGEMIQNKLPYLIKLNKWPDVNILCKKVLNDSVDRWDVWKYYLSSVFELNKSINNHVESNNKPNIEENAIRSCENSLRSGDSDENDDNQDILDDTPEKAHEFICKLVENGADNGYLLRGPYLARFELCKKLKAKDTTEDSANDLLGDVMELFIEYFRKFGHKPCCVSDLREYLDLLDSDRRLDLAGKIVRDVGISSTSVPQSETQMQRHICALQFSRLCGIHKDLSLDHIKALVTAFSLHYQHGHHTYGQDLLSTDQAPADAYSLLAAHLLFDLHWKTKTSQPLVTALVLLKHTLKNSPCNFHLKLLALRIYHILGCTLGAQVVYDGLDIKHLQLDSMCFGHTAALSSSGHYILASSLFDATLKFFSTNYKDSSYHLTFSYKFGSFLKLNEFMEFRERMNNSFHYISTAVDRMFLTLVLCSANEQIHGLDMTPREDPVDWKEMRCNSDLSVYVSWDPERIPGPLEDWEHIKSIQTQDVAALKLRVAILDCIQLALQLLKTKENAKNTAKQIEDAVDKWRTEQEHVLAQKYVPIEQNLLCMPFPSRLQNHLKAPYHRVLTTVFAVVTSVATENAELTESSVNKAKAEYSAMIGMICTYLDEETCKGDVFLGRRNHLEFVCNIIEICSITSVLIILCVELTKSMQSGKKKKKYDSRLKEYILDLVNNTKEQTNKFDVALEKWQQKSSTADVINEKQSLIGILGDLSDKLATLNLNSDNAELNNLNKSFSEAVKEMRMFLKNKTKMLQSVS